MSGTDRQPLSGLSLLLQACVWNFYHCTCGRLYWWKYQLPRGVKRGGTRRCGCTCVCQTPLDLYHHKALGTACIQPVPSRHMLYQKRRSCTAFSSIRGPSFCEGSHSMLLFYLTCPSSLRRLGSFIAEQGATCHLLEQPTWPAWFESAPKGDTACLVRSLVNETGQTSRSVSKTPGQYGSYGSERRLFRVAKVEIRCR